MDHIKINDLLYYKLFIEQEKNKNKIDYQNNRHLNTSFDS